SARGGPAHRSRRPCPDGAPASSGGNPHPAWRPDADCGTCLAVLYSLVLLGLTGSIGAMSGFSTVPGSALTLLVPRIRADDHDPAMPADDPALAADLLHTRLDLHRELSPQDARAGWARHRITCTCRRSAHG